MQEDLAWKIIVADFAASRPLQDLLFELKERLDEDEYRIWARRIATSLAQQSQQLTSEVLKEHPQLRGKIESDLEKFGRLS